VKCNSLLFLNQGFLAQNNQAHNTVQMKVSLNTEDPMLAVKLGLINQNELSQTFAVLETLTTRSTY